MAKKIKKYKVGINSETYAISLVESPAIESDFIALSKEEEDKLQVFLESNEKHMLYGAALIPEKDIYRNNGEQEFYINFSKESIERMSQDFMKEYRQYEIKTDHEDVANEVCVVESWLVSDSYKDKSNALGINVPEGTWMVGLKVNNIETWERVKAGELKGFSVESMISLEEFGKQNNTNMNIETNDMFFDKIKNVFKEVLSSVGLSKENEPDPIEPIDMEDLAANSGFSSVEDYKKEVEAIKAELEEQNAEPTPEPAAEPKPAEEPKPDAANATQDDTHPAEEPKVEEPKPAEPEPAQDNHLEELIRSLKDEVEALKKMNSGLNSKVKELSKQPSAQPVNVNAKPTSNDTYSAWREQMRNMIG